VGIVITWILAIRVEAGELVGHSFALRTAALLTTAAACLTPRPLMHMPLGRLSAAWFQSLPILKINSLRR
jgi:hypothetical protein